MALELVIVCKSKNCGEEFRLRASNQEERFEGQLASSKGIERANFWCWICGTVFPYTAQDCHWKESRTSDQDQHHGGKTAYRTVLQCGRENCETPVTVHTITDDGPNASGLKDRAHRMNGKLVCQQGHEFSLRAGKRDLHFYQIAAEQIC
jgi:hypothetical protein